ncbi:hypothetical protein EDC96DRAFT_449658, partial [Choanephora cucurbitarum]
GLKDDGFYTLTAKMNSTKKTFDEVKSFYNIRTLHMLLSAAHKEMEWTAQTHLNLAQKLKNRLEIDLDNFILEQKDKRKLTHANVEKVHRYKQSSEAYLTKTKEKYEADCAKLKTLEQEYKNACTKVADATENWNKAWKMSCDTYQGMEKKRLEFLHHSFFMYINMVSTATSQNQESYEHFWKSLDQYDPVEDIKRFISEKGTGPQIPEPEVFVPYSEDPQKTLQRYTYANFSAPQELQTEPTDQITIKEETPEISIANKDPVERKKSIIRNVVKPLPSITTPLMRVRRKSTQRQEIQSQSTSFASPPVLVVPDLAGDCSSNGSDSENNSAKANAEDEDVSIDPRAKVVFAIGNNVFDLGNLDLEDHPIIPSTTSSHTRYSKGDKKHNNSSNNRTMVRQRRRSVDYEAASNISYQSLLEELGLFNESNNKCSKPTPTRNATKIEREKNEREQNTNHEPKRSSSTLNSSQPYQPAYSHYLPYSSSTHSRTHASSNDYAYYSRLKENMYCPPSNIPQGTQPTLFWALALDDWYTGNPEELQYSRGTWLAVTEVQDNGWYFAAKFDPRANCLTNETGYVAQNYVQVYS